MKVLLINPPALSEIKGNNPKLIDSERGYNPPLGLLYIAAAIKAWTPHQVDVIDAQVEDLTYDQLKERIIKSDPDVVGLTAMTFTLLDVMATLAIVKSVDKEIITLLGGPHGHIYPKETAALAGVDIVVTGEGEKVIPEILEHLENLDRLAQIPGLCFRKGGDIIYTGLPAYLEDLDSLPMPARELVPYQKYTSLLAKRNPITTMFTSRGCPYQCVFCDRPHMGRRFRFRSTASVITEFEECLKLGIHEFLIYDDTFTINKKRVFEICDEIIGRRLDIGWDFRANVNTIDLAMLKRLKEANCERIHYGVEAGSDRVLKVLKKGTTVERIKNVIKMTKEVGIDTLGYFIIGSPTETAEDIKRTIDFAIELDPDYVHITIMTPFPATQLYRDGLDQGIIKEDYWQKFALAPNPDFQPGYWEENFTRDELQRYVVMAYKKFYTRPRYILKRLFKIHSALEFARKAKAGLKVLFMDKPYDAPRSKP
jgi:radical SAM superfamily enzyme YgiQ (UPF0313 family)